MTRRWSMDGASISGGGGEGVLSRGRGSESNAGGDFAIGVWSAGRGFLVIELGVLGTFTGEYGRLRVGRAVHIAHQSGRYVEHPPGLTNRQW